MVQGTFQNPSVIWDEKVTTRWDSKLGTKEYGTQTTKVLENSEKFCGKTHLCLRCHYEAEH